MKAPIARRLRTVRVRTTVVATAVLVTVLVVAEFVLANRFERELMHQVDERLVLSTDYVARVGATDERFPPIGTATDLVQVVDDQGRITYGSPAHRNDTALWTPGSGEREPHTVRTSDHGELRVSAVRFRDRWVVFATSLAAVDDDVRALERAMLVTLPPLALALTLLVWVVVGRTLRPVAAAVEREERLVADVSHELRSPLAGLRVLLETEPSQPQQTQLSRIEALAALGRLETITDQLLAPHAQRPGRRARPRPSRRPRRGRPRPDRHARVALAGPDRRTLPRRWPGRRARGPTRQPGREPTDQRHPPRPHHRQGDPHRASRNRRARRRRRRPRHRRGAPGPHLRAIHPSTKHETETKAAPAWASPSFAPSSRPTADP